MARLTFSSVARVPSVDELRRLGNMPALRGPWNPDPGVGGLCLGRYGSAMERIALYDSAELALR